MERRIRLALLFGGRSCEHEVSVASARSVLAAIDPARYEVHLVGISRDGRWHLGSELADLVDGGVVTGARAAPARLGYGGGGALVSTPGDAGETVTEIDVVFPLLHGPFGEDGTVQGLLELTGLPYIGSGVVGSAAAMDKEVMKRAFRAEGLPVLDFRVVRVARWRDAPGAALDRIEAALPYPMFVKPANLGSSVGITRVTDRAALERGVETAAAYDYKVVVEAAAPESREVECSVLGNEDPRASVAGEIVPGGEFYDYDAKYVDDSSELLVPAPISASAMSRVQALSVAAFRAVEAAGLARVDFFVARKDETVYVNEINTMPGFTPISMYPKLWEASGLDYRSLVDRLVDLALERHRDRRHLRNAR